MQSQSVHQSHNSDIAARLISDLINPLILPVLVFAAAGIALNHSAQEILEVVGVSSLLFFAIPFSTAILILRHNPEKTLDFHDRTIRAFLYLVTIFFGGIGGLLIFDEQFTGIHKILFLTYMINLSTAFLVNFKWKLSVHIGSVVTAVLLLLWLSSIAEYYMIPMVFAALLSVLSPFIVWSRMYLEVHNWFELKLGSITAFLVTSFCLWVFV